MATTTTNFGWDIPQSTDLVKDGATAIAALGQDIDTAFVDFKGGTTGQVLKKTSNTDLDVEWGTASSGLTLINTTSFSGVSSASFPNDSFTTTYINYLVFIDAVSSAAGVEFRMRYRASGSDHTGTEYREQAFSASSTTLAGARRTGDNYQRLGDLQSGNKNLFQVYLKNIKQTEKPCGYVLHSYDIAGNIDISNRHFGLNSTTAFDSISIFPTSGTITGEMSLYGLGK